MSLQRKLKRNKFSKLSSQAHSSKTKDPSSPYPIEKISSYFTPLSTNSPSTSSLVGELPIKTEKIDNSFNTSNDEDAFEKQERNRIPKSNINVLNPRNEETVKKKKTTATLPALFRKKTLPTLHDGDTNEEHLQLAIAISKSLQELDNSQSNDSNSDLDNIKPSTQDKVAKIKQTLDQFGFKSNRVLNPFSITKNNPKVQKRKRFKYVTPTLFLRTEYDRQKQIETKVSEIITNVSIYNETVEETLSRSLSNNEAESSIYGLKPRSFLLRDYYNENATLFRRNRLAQTEFKTEMFYNGTVSAEHVNIDVLLRDWGSIPGREKTPELEVNTLQVNNEINANSGSILGREKTPELEVNTLQVNNENDEIMSPVLFSDDEKTDNSSSATEIDICMIPTQINNNNNNVNKHIEASSVDSDNSVKSVSLLKDMVSPKIVKKSNDKQKKQSDSDDKSLSSFEQYVSLVNKISEKKCKNSSDTDSLSSFENITRKQRKSRSPRKPKNITNSGEKFVVTPTGRKIIKRQENVSPAASCKKSLFNDTRQSTNLLNTFIDLTNSDDEDVELLPNSIEQNRILLLSSEDQPSPEYDCANTSNNKEFYNSLSRSDGNSRSSNNSLFSDDEGISKGETKKTSSQENKLETISLNSDDEAHEINSSQNNKTKRKFLYHTYSNSDTNDSIPDDAEEINNSNSNSEINQVEKSNARRTFLDQTFSNFETEKINYDSICDNAKCSNESKTKIKFLDESISSFASESDSKSTDNANGDVIDKDAVSLSQSSISTVYWDEELNYSCNASLRNQRAFEQISDDEQSSDTNVSQNSNNLNSPVKNSSLNQSDDYTEDHNRSKRKLSLEYETQNKRVKSASDNETDEIGAIRGNSLIQNIDLIMDERPMDDFDNNWHQNDEFNNSLGGISSPANKNNSPVATTSKVENLALMRKKLYDDIDKILNISIEDNSDLMKNIQSHSNCTKEDDNNLSKQSKGKKLSKTSAKKISNNEKLDKSQSSDSSENISPKSHVKEKKTRKSIGRRSCNKKGEIIDHDVKENILRQLQKQENTRRSQITGINDDSDDLNNSDHENNIDHLNSFTTPIKITSTNANDYIIKTGNVTPPKNYSAMDSPELLRHLDKYGIKRLKKNQAVKILRYLYDVTHPILQNDVCNNSGDDEEINNLSTSSKNNNINLSVNVNQHQLVESVPLEEMIFERKYSSKIKSCRLPLHIAWHNLLSVNQKLHEQVLLYEPIQVEEVYSIFKSMGYKYHLQDIIAFLDKKCITIRIAQTSRNVNREKLSKS